MNYFLIPGNPPVVYFYEQWGTEINELHVGSTVRVSHYPNLKHGIKSEVAIAEVMAAHLAQLEKFQSEVKGPVTVIGHSLGGFFALKLLEAAPEKISKLYLLYPFLRMPTLRGRAILVGVGALWGADKLHQVLSGSRKVAGLLNPEYSKISKDEIIRAFHLAKHESHTIGKDKSPIVIKPELREKVRVYHCKKDDWCVPEVLVQLKEQVPVYECEEPHGFIMREKHRRSLFTLIIASFSKP